VFDPWKFKEQILGHLEDVYKTNEDNLKWRIGPTKIIIVVLSVEAMAVVATLLLTLVVFG
jgi:hypothetical protein